ncbi:MAG: hypothetical protein HC860_10300 [Alkalinema sp. RU_4_3]|nr:hypothetical protein [Alkalinema sp. RU_4_3]
MSRTLHDEFAKDWMKEFLADFGSVETEFEISGEVRSVDVHFVPNPELLPAPIGYLGSMITKPCLIEPFRNAVPGMAICNCRSKSTILGHKLVSQAQLEKRRFRFDDRPFLWIISPTLSKRMQKKYCMHSRTEWGEGIYFLPEGDQAAVIAVHQLPETPESLWLRLLGRDNVQKRAMAELVALPKDYPYREISLRHIMVLQKKLAVRHNLSRDLQEVAMTLAITYEQIEAELLEKGELNGIRKIALALLRDGMPPEKVAQITELPIDIVEGFANEQLPRLED